MCFVCVSEQRAMNALQIINCLLLMKEDGPNGRG